MKAKSLVHIAKFYSPDRGGIETVTKYLANFSVSHFHSVRVIAFTNDRKKVGVEKLNGVVVERYYARFNFFSQPLSMSYMLRILKVIQTTDIVHAHAPNYLAMLPTLLSRGKAKLIIHWHSDVLDKPKIFMKLLLALQNKWLKSADAVIVTSKDYLLASEPLSVCDPEKTFVVSLGIAIDNEMPRFQLPPVIKKYLKEKRKIILSIGRLVEYKDFLTLIKASQYLKDDCVIVIVGKGPQYTALKSQISQLGVEDKVLLVGHLSDPELKGVLKFSTIFCLPSKSRAEAFGVVLLEAMANKIPLVTCDLVGSGVNHVNQDGVTGLRFRIGDEVDLAQKLNLLLTSKQLHKSLSIGAFDRLREQFLVTDACDKTMLVYRRVVG